jgi:alpha-tubulin suppressor-like RCC1 family protein
LIVGAGEVRCWGFNDRGQLGDGTTTDRAAPVPVLRAAGGPPLTGAKALGLGVGFSCALMDGGEVHCWGYNAFAELGDGTTVTRSTPSPVMSAAQGPPLTGVRALAVGSNHACASLESGELRCWGYNGSRQLGNDDVNVASSTLPVPVTQGAGKPPVEAGPVLASGESHSCATLAGGQTHCWGKSGDGRLGNGTSSLFGSTAVPSLVLQGQDGPSFGDASALSAGETHTCAVSSGAREVWCWGNNRNAQLGDPAAPAVRPLAGRVVVGAGGGPAAGVRAVAAGLAHTCALSNEGTVQCWGWNAHGQVGDGANADRATPATVLSEANGPPLTGVLAVALGHRHTCALTGERRVACWGRNDHGQLGDATTTDRPFPVPVTVP